MDIKTGKSTLHYAAEGGYLSICRMLLDNGATPLNLDKFGKTPVHLAVTCGHVAVVNFLLMQVNVSYALIAHFKKIFQCICLDLYSVFLICR